MPHSSIYHSPTIIPYLSRFCSTPLRVGLSLQDQHAGPSSGRLAPTLSDALHIISSIATVHRVSVSRALPSCRGSIQL
ncbi:Uncharacterized protein HZ326_27030 [Fusarium oxysporum f. sp. albedinis]|nr:Uncharacterized protein HZ326_27030 [Fusarium oxysporum f. sp. albedinis]